jgi:hypothetical protein
MNRLTCTLLSGASIVALMFGGDLAKGISAKAASVPAGAGFATTGDEDFIIISGNQTDDVVVSAGDTVTGPPAAPADITATLALPFAPGVTGQFGFVNDGFSVDGQMIVNGAVQLSITGTGLDGGDAIVGLANVSGTVVGGMVNNGTVDIFASDLDSAGATAIAAGVVATGVTGTTFLNGVAGVLSVNAFASDTDAANGASALAIGVFQNAVNDDVAVANVTNNGIINVSATAVLNALDGPAGTAITAYAAASGVVQFVNATGVDGDATAFFDNNGNLNVKASASAIGDVSGAAATASAVGVWQAATAVDLAKASFINDLGVNVDGIAFASAGDQYAVASAFATGVIQFASGADATAVIINNGIFNVSADAQAKQTATGTSAGASANAFAIGFAQTAVASGVASVSVNNANVLNVDAVADATGVTNSIGAGAYATGIFQQLGSAEGLSVPETGNAFVRNGNIIDVTAVAHANMGVNTANTFSAQIEAQATAFGVRQEFSAANNAAATVVNVGSFDVSAIAVADAASQSASAQAVAVGIRQDIFLTAATNADTNIAQANVTNSALIHVAATASAFNEGVNIGTTTPTGIVTFTNGNPFAFASAVVTGIDQAVFGSGGTSGIALFDNNALGILSVEANAFASGVSAQASADAVGVTQSVGSGKVGGFTFAHADVENDGHIKVVADASAVVDQATTATNANASAFAEGVVQFASASGATDADAIVADAIVNNVGVISVTAHAVARVVANTFTYTTTNPANPNTQTYTFTDSFPVGNAQATASAEGIHQDALAVLTATASVVNSGIINVHASATAVTPDDESIDDGISNYAGANAEGLGIHQTANAGTNTTVGEVALAKFLNDGTAAQLNVVAAAKATGSTAWAGAYAQGVLQVAGTGSAVLSAAAQVTNEGLISVLAKATAHGLNASDYYDGFAEASATGIDQNVEGQTAGLALVDNSGSIKVGATAFADFTGTGFASAEAYAVGIIQVARADGDFADPTDGPTGHATAHVVNGGLIDVVGFASAVAEGTVYAGASATGLIQDVDGSTLAQALFDNFKVNGTLTTPGQFHVSAHGFASSTSSAAQAEGHVYGVFQNASASSGDALASIVNPGSITVEAHATASANDGAQAFAEGLGISQIAVAQQSTGADQVVRADAIIVNSGTIDVGASAIAQGGEGTASAYVSGINQFASAQLNPEITGTAEGAAVALASVDNSGDINIHALASAIEDYGYAHASAGVSAIHQDAGAIASGTAATAIAQVINDGTIVASASAIASGANNVHAGALAFGINQDAGAIASLTAAGSAIVHNGGTISVLANASAHVTALGNDGDQARAGATATGIVQDAGAIAFADDPEAVATAIASVTNQGLILVSADALAFGTNAGASAYASAIRQDAGAFAPVNPTAIGQASALVVNNGDITAKAVATGFGITNGYAHAGATGIVQVAIAQDLALASVVNTSLATINVTASAAANGSDATAGAYAAGIFQDAGAATSGGQDPIAVARASAIVSNSGVISVNANATAEGGDVGADADAVGINQAASIFGGGAGSSSVALASVVNSGTLEVAAVASAAGNIASAYADAEGINQAADGVGNPDSTAQAIVINSGALHVTASAVAAGEVFGEGGANAEGINQDVYDAQNLFASVVNSDEIIVAATASGTGYRADLDADAAGIIQQAQGGSDGTSQVAVLTVDNSGTISVVAQAVANGGNTLLGFASFASASATATGIRQSAFSIGNVIATDAEGGGTAFNPTGAVTELVDNSGEIHVTATASANGGNGNFAYAEAWGVLQDAGGEAQSFDIAVLNSGTIEVNATAVATGDGDGEADATAGGIIQGVDGNYATDQTALVENTVAQAALLSVSNSGTIEVLADASATGTGEVFAGARAVGIRQGFSGFGDQNNNFTTEDAASYHYADVTAVVHNAGHLNVSALAVASEGDTNTAHATASGIDIGAGDYEVLHVDVTNSGSSIEVFASAAADGGSANAYAVGVNVVGAQIEGTILNTGLIRAEAVADGDYEFASAVGINVHAFSEFRGNITVSGGTVAAIASGSSARAVGIRISEPTSQYNAGGSAEGAFSNRTDYGAESTGVGTINIIDSTIFAGVTNDGGLSMSRGTAIDVSLTPNPIVINLDGEVDIFGNILLSGNDELNINGSLFFDGAINPGTTLAAVGVVNVGAGATLTVANNPTDGPAYLNVGVFNQNADAVVVFEARGEDGSNAPNTIGSIFAQTSANLAGTAVVRLRTGLYDDMTFPSVVAVGAGGVLNGEWDNVVLDRDYLFFSVDPVYNSGSVDIVLERHAFDSVGGLTFNQGAVAGGLEGAYDTNLSGGFGGLVQNLLFQTNAGTFADYLQQISGVEHGQKVHAELQVQNLLKDIVTQKLQTVPEIGSRTEGFSLNSVWISGVGRWGNMVGTDSAGG